MVKEVIYNLEFIYGECASWHGECRYVLVDTDVEISLFNGYDNVGLLYGIASHRIIAVQGGELYVLCVGQCFQTLEGNLDLLCLVTNVHNLHDIFLRVLVVNGRSTESILSCYWFLVFSQ